MKNSTQPNADIVWHQHAVDQAARAAQKGQQPVLLWFTGLSGAGKSTLAGAWSGHCSRRGFIPICSMATMCVMVFAKISASAPPIGMKTCEEWAKWRT